MNSSHFSTDLSDAEVKSDLRVARLLAWYRVLRSARARLGGSGGRLARRIAQREEGVWVQVDAVLWVDRRLWRFEVTP